MKPIIFFTALFSFGIWLGTFIIKKSHQVEVSKQYGVSQDGFQKTPDTYFIVASPAYKWEHGNKGIIWLAYVLIAAGFLIAWWLDSNDKGSPKLILFILITIAYLVAFSKEAVGYYDKQKFKITVSKETYEANKDHLETLFP